MITEEVKLTVDGHIYQIGDRKLTSVTSVIRQVWPTTPEFSAAPEAVIENARERGCEVDEIFSKWLNDEFAEEIPTGYRQDSTDLAAKLIDWWIRQRFTTVGVKAQEILHDADIAGCADIVIAPPAGAVYDNKTTYDIEPTYRIQVGGYCELYEAKYGEPPARAGIIHNTKRFKEPKLIDLDVAKVTAEWKTVRRFWELTSAKASAAKRSA